ncbi:hypothetical protein E1B28_006848 [Marasmius oreades]|uniref:Uncharacterized protein n=1 Tax=Marasmius oreades TaxID=181124 RepID=A0A9P7UWY1_9AGAR|nr:uncharacterized protein E1B28_006848 [Marasmius oreades]KAG7096175.1 hypothetical protein E1B28_006848 [Marasmius oreades]
MKFFVKASEVFHNESRKIVPIILGLNLYHYHKIRLDPWGIFPGTGSRLAIATYTCQQCGVKCITAQGAIAHLNSSRCKRDSVLCLSPFTFTPDPLVFKLVLLIGLPPWNATTNDMDNRNPLFRCLACVDDDNDDYLLYTWHNCLNIHTWHDNASFEVVTGATDIEVLDLSTWSCAHCNIDVNDPKFRVILDTHLSTAIEEPKAPIDRFYLPS